MRRLAVLVALLIVAGAGVARADDAELGSPFLGPDGEVRTLVRPEFRSAPGLLEDLQAFGVPGLEITLMGPLVAHPQPGKPPIPSRLLLRGDADAVTSGRAALDRLDVPRPAVLVSLLATEVVRDGQREMGGRFGFRRFGIPEAPKTVFRGLYSEFEPDSYLRSNLIGQSVPFQGTSIGFANIGQTVLEDGAFELVLRHLAHEGQAEFLAWPSIVCSEGRPGFVESLETREHRVIAAATQDPGNLGIRAEDLSSGIGFSVVPVRVGTDTCVLDLEADVQYLLPESADGLAAGEMVVHHRRVATQVTVRDGEAMLIGGLKVRRRIDARRGLPLLNGIPPFSARTDTCRETELLLLLKARILLPERDAGLVRPARAACRPEDAKGPNEERPSAKREAPPTGACPDPWE